MFRIRDYRDRYRGRILDAGKVIRGRVSRAVIDDDQFPGGSGVVREGGDASRVNSS